MALTACPECNHHISDKAHSCPKCGHPLQANKVYVTNPTKGKGKKALGIILILFALLLSATTYGKPRSSSTELIGGLSITIGIILLIVGKIQHWWHCK